MIYAFDVAYNENNIAQAVAIGFSKWEAERFDVIHREFIIGLEAYQPGEFYKRELPCIEKVLRRVDQSSMDLVVIDGYVYLDDDQKPGLGLYLHEKLGGKIPVIGVAKTFYTNNARNVIEVFRGASLQPLYVSAVGVHLNDAAQWIKSMQGNFRIPTLLKKLDQETKR